MFLKGNIKKSFTKTFAELTIYNKHHLIWKKTKPHGKKQRQMRQKEKIN